MENQFQLKIDSHVVRQLGEELITDSEQALLELIKNSYDAGAKWCHVEVDTTTENFWNPDTKTFETIEQLQNLLSDEEASKRISLLGSIIVRDNGSGMSQQELEQGWLTISASPKRELKKSKTKVGNRSLQGDKGLGRLSAMRLGRFLRIDTRKKDTDPLSLAIDWNTFNHGTVLSDIEVFELTPKSNSKGAMIEVLGLKDIARWKGSDSSQKIKAALSSLISPFDGEGEFKVYLKIDGIEHDLDIFEEKIEEFVNAKTSYSFDGKHLKALGKIKLPFFLPNKTEGDESTTYSDYKKFIKSDAGRALFKVIAGLTRLKDYEIRLSDEPGWFLEFSKTISWSDVELSTKQEILKPGSFTSEWYQVVKRGLALTTNELTSKTYDTEIKTIVENLIGVGVYKGDFRVGNKSNTDWLNFSESQTSGYGFYSIRPSNLIGYIKFPGYEGQTLQETSDRQGFVEDDVFNGFMALTTQMKDFANLFFNLARKESNRYIKEQTNNFFEEEESSETAEEMIENSIKLHDSLKSKNNEFEKSSRKVKKFIDKIDGFINEEVVPHKEKRSIESFIKNLREAIEEERELMNKIFYSTERIAFDADKLNEYIQSFNERIEDLHGIAAIGLSAESLAHDINTLLSNIQTSGRKLMNMARSKTVDTERLGILANQIINNLAVISKEVSIINPMLRTKRMQLSEFKLSDEVSNFVNLRSSRLANRDIEVEIFLSGNIDIIKFSVGRLTQVLDNLFRNSEYWLEVYKNKFDIAYFGLSGQRFRHHSDKRSGVVRTS